MVGLVLVLMLANGCAEESNDPDVSSETHWLANCSDDGQCGPDANCVCGLCTLRCGAGCDGSGPGLTCVAEPTTCAGLESNVCLPECTVNGDCTALGPHLICDAGHCEQGGAAPACTSNDQCPSGASCGSDHCTCDPPPDCTADQQLECLPSGDDHLNCLICECR